MRLKRVPYLRGSLDSAGRHARRFFFGLVRSGLANRGEPKKPSGYARGEGLDRPPSGASPPIGFPSLSVADHRVLSQCGLMNAPS
jgi:hypothetical protein